MPNFEFDSRPRIAPAPAPPQPRKNQEEKTKLVSTQRLDTRTSDPAATMESTNSEEPRKLRGLSHSMALTFYITRNGLQERDSNLRAIDPRPTPTTNAQCGTNPTISTEGKESRDGQTRLGSPTTTTTTTHHGSDQENLTPTRTNEEKNKKPRIGVAGGDEWTKIQEQG